jgi:hypothetical protein
MGRWKRKTLAIAAGGVGLLAIGATTYWQLHQGQCTQVRASGSQEVTYSRGCINPQRYRKWTVTAMQ